MTVINKQSAPSGLFSSLFAPVINLCEAINHLAHATNVVCEIVDEAAIRTKDISLLALDQQHAELLARQQMLTIN